MLRALTLILLVMLVLPAAAAARPATGFVDDFTSLDPTRWRVGEHQLGRSRLLAQNVSVNAGALALTLPQGSTDGAEIRSTSTFAGGVARTRVRAADAPSSLTGFFLYAPPDLASEIDIEILDDPSGTALLSTYANGRQTHTETRALGFDPTAAFHDYEIRWSNAGVTFSVDGAALRTWTTGVPRAPMNLYVNAWFPTWLGGLAPPEPRSTTVDQIEYRSRLTA